MRFGQHTIFMPLLLKPAPTRLRLVLWSLFKNIDEFPSAPPPGLVTVPSETLLLSGLDTMSGYRNAGERAIRVDMLERLADMLRSQDSKSGFECNSDMLSITGMTLEQFAGLMIGLGYKTEKGTRLKAVSEKESETEINQELGKANSDDSEKDPIELHEVFYKFFWKAKTVNKGKNYSPKAVKLNKKKGKPLTTAGSKNVRSPQKNTKNQDKPIDPDNPFAKALMGFKQDN